MSKTFWKAYGVIIKTFSSYEEACNELLNADEEIIFSYDQYHIVVPKIQVSVVRENNSHLSDF